VSLGRAWILFIGLIFGYFYLISTAAPAHFMKELGLILFVYSIVWRLRRFRAVVQKRRQGAQLAGGHHHRHHVATALTIF
jgi:hypothetical protein